MAWPVAVGGGARCACAVPSPKCVVHAAKRALVDLSRFRTRERHTPMFRARRRRPAPRARDTSIASWSPSQSAPLTVSYMCQRQSSSPILPSEAEMPPWAATVCERVGKTLLMQAVRRPDSLQPTVAPQAGATSADDHHVEGVVGDGIGPRRSLRARHWFVRSSPCFFHLPQSKGLRPILRIA